MSPSTNVRSDAPSTAPSTSAPALTHIRKRSGRCVAYDQHKITRAIEKAMRASGELADGLPEAVTAAVHATLLASCEGERDCVPGVEQVQDIVEMELMRARCFATAKAYILYREQHAQIRRMVATEHVDLVDRYLSMGDWLVKENANMAFSLQGLNNFIAAEVSKTYWLEKVYPPEIREHHRSGDYHIHDLSQLSVYCVGWDLYDLLKRGFGGVPGKIQSKPPKHFRAALGQMVNFFYTLQGEAAGAQAFSNVDTLLAPFIYYDHLSYAEVKQAMQEFIFNVNVPTRVGFQTPFTNVTLDLNVPDFYQNERVICGGERQRERYGEFQREMDLFNQAFLEVMTEGDASGRVFTFPIPTYNITSDFDWEDERVEQLWQVAGKYGIPYFSNFINSDMSPDDARSMCCRLRIDNRELEKRGGGLFGANPLTGSIGVVTMNLPRIGHDATNEAEFQTKLGELMDSARDSLEIKRKVLERMTEGGLYPYTSYYLQAVKQSLGYYWDNHFSTIGLVGMNEACLGLLGADITSEAGQAFANRTLDFMRERLAAYQEATGHHYNLEATPAEGTTYRLAQLDQKRSSDMQFANGVGAEVVDPYYTNSTHMPVGHTDDLFEALDLQDELQSKYTGGTVVHLFLGERIEDGAVVKKLVRRICEHYQLPYFTFSPTFSVCPVHGYLAGEQPECPHCAAATEVYSRIVGYLRPVEQWNRGKRAEYEERQPLSTGKAAAAIAPGSLATAPAAAGSETASTKPAQ